MTNLTPAMFAAPTIALAGTVWLYIYFRKSAADKLVFQRFMRWVTALAFLLNFAWEILHCPLYQGGAYALAHIPMLALASLADAIMVDLLYLGFALVYQNGLWAQPLTLLRAFWLMAVGGVGAILFEVAHLSAGNWAYTDKMLLIPGTGAGLSPVLQFTLLPVLIYSLSFHLATPKADSKLV
ncbi:hypothetical protein J4D97_15635 [Hymenobacter defluvii]|uniref:Lycopene cyclase domain-containing protein n=2 Tax=Hymenobacter defluvii TaxID=2054411 RepID=A0ABS3TEL1_9BACT|nr:hypothetical protein [Hymenobacter defluvii]